MNSQSSKVRLVPEFDSSGKPTGKMVEVSEAIFSNITELLKAEGVLPAAESAQPSGRRTWAA